MKSVVIIGGGIIGLCSAHYLNKQGYDVTVIDSCDLTDGTSFGNAGYVSPSHFIPLASPAVVGKALRWMLNASSPFYVKPRLDPDLLRWGMAFWKSSRESYMMKNIPHLNNILCFSRDLTIAMKNELGNHFRMEEKGCLMLYRERATEKQEQALAQQAAGIGLMANVLNAAEVQSLEPRVAVAVRGGVLYPIDCHLHPGDLMETLRASLLYKGVKFELRTAVTGFERQGRTITAVLTDKGAIPCAELVMAAGSWLPGLLRKLDIGLLLQPGKGYSMTYPEVERNLCYPAILIERRVAMTPMGADLRMGGTMEISGYKRQIIPKRVAAIYDAAKTYYPGLRVDFPKTESVWQGLRPLSPDGLPYIGRHSGYRNLIIAGGHAMLGLSLAAATGYLVEELISGKSPSINMSAFSTERFN